VVRQKEIRVLDLFAGVGGLTAGFHAAAPERYRTVRAVEMDHAAAAGYEATFGKDIAYAGSIQDWLRDDDVPEVDVVVGGPPCQGFSTLGKQDAEDERNSLWQQYAETIRRSKPKYFVVENVAAFAKSSQFGDFQAAVAPDGFLADYDFDHRVLNAADFGAPQARKRAVLIGHHRDLDFPGFPDPTHSAHPERDGLPPHRTVRDVLQHVPAEPDRDARFSQRTTNFNGKRYAGSFVARDLHWSRNYSELSLNRFAHIKEGENRFALPEQLLAACWKSHRSGSGDVMGRLHWDRPAVTIRTEFFKPEKGRYLHPDSRVLRAITHYEAALLQGFPKTHRFIGSKTAIARQIGNAVPIPLGKAIAAQLAQKL